MEMEKKLCEAALEGNVSSLEALIQEDPIILDRITPTFFQNTPLHIATQHGHLEFARALLSHNPRLATEPDSLGHLPLHVASANGHVEIVRELLRVEPSSCLARSKDGKLLPLHLAIVKGVRVEVVSELARASPESTRLRVDGGDTALHLCVEYGKLDALRVLMELLRVEDDGSDLLNSKNDDGNSVLHLAALRKHLEITKYLLATPGIEPNAVNNNGLTPLDLIENSPKDLKTLELLNFLLQSNIQKSPNNHTKSSIQPTKPSQTPSENKPSKRSFFTFNGKNINQLEDMKGEILITAAIIALINASPIIYMRINDPKLLDLYAINFGSFVPAVTIMVILLAGFPLNNKLCAALVIQLMYSAVGFLGYGGYLNNMISFEGRYSKLSIALILMGIWYLLLIILSTINVIRLIVWVVKNIKGWRSRSISENAR